ncbi:MAG: DUF6596 domain-containing protein [Pseudomonadota bacterium]
MHTVRNPGAGFARDLAQARPMVVAALSAHLRDLDAAEEAFAEACAALSEADAVPDNLAGWLITVGKRKAIDAIRKRGAQQRAGESAAYLKHPEGGDMGEVIELPEPIADERLRLIFICCHPALALDARAALALKVICGLPVSEIARLFLVPEPTMYQRITRAKAKIRDAGVSFELPPRKAWDERIEAVLLTLELAYTAAYQDAAGSRPGNEGGELAEEIERLAQILAALLPGEPEALGMAALVTLARSREGARVDAAGAMVPLSKQDTARWDLERVERARAWLDEAQSFERIGPYQIMAAIQLTQARRHFDGATDWRAILALYEALMMLRPGPIVALNRVLALAQVEGAARALEELEALDLGSMEAARPVLVARARLLEEAGRVDEALGFLNRALGSDPARAERMYLESWQKRLRRA